MIDWSKAPEGTTHAMNNGGEMRWYRVGDKVECWHNRYREWIQSFFLSVDDAEVTGLRMYAFGEQSATVVLKQERDALLAALEDLVHIVADARHPDPDDVYATIAAARAVIARCRG